MAEYLHGAYGQVNAVGSRVSDEGLSAIVCIGTAPVHTLGGGAKNINVPILIRNIEEAKKYLGYSEDWASYTLCEVMHVFFEYKGVGPLVFINILDPSKHFKTEAMSVSKTPSSGAFTISDAQKIILDTLVVETKVEGTDYTVAYDEVTHTITVTEKTTGSLGTDALTVTYSEIKEDTVSKTPSNGRIQIANASGIILDSIEVATKTKGTDYAVSFNPETETITISELTDGGLGSSALSITYRSIDPATVTDADVIGSTDGLGLNSGTYAMKDVYQVTGCIPAYMIAPGFSSVPAVHAAMHANSIKINKHWDAYMFVDLPITSGGTDITLDTVVTFKTTNGYNKENETVYFPMAKGSDGKKYHLSVLAAANFQELMIAQEGIPFRTASNTECALIENLYLGEAYVGRIFDDSIINEKLNKNGIASAAYVGGRWAIWGAHSADYNQDDATYVSVAETNRMMLYYISNDFQNRRTLDVDQPLTPNDIKTIVSEEQTRLDALVAVGALTYGVAMLNASAQERSDIISGDWQFSFNVTTTPLAKSLKAVVNWTDEGFETYFENEAAE